MKKTLIAVAALAASSAFAQVTITGEFAFGYAAKSNAAGVTGADSSGFGTNTSEIYFGVSEDLGGGMKFDGVMQMGGLDRLGYTNAGDGGVAGKDFKMKLTTASSGAIQLATAKSASYLTGGVAGLGVAWDGLDGRVFSARSSRDSLTYTLPSLATGLTLAVAHQEAGGELGEGSGQAGSNKQRMNAYALNYATGALMIDAQYLAHADFSNADTTNKSTTRLAGTYDFGMAKLGAGVEATAQGGSGKVTDTLIAVKVPMGNLTLGAQLGSRNIADSTATTNGQRSGYNLNAWYNLSKRTYLIAQYSRYDAVVAAASATQETHLLMVHDF